MEQSANAEPWSIRQIVKNLLATVKTSEERLRSWTNFPVGKSKSNSNQSCRRLDAEVSAHDSDWRGYFFGSITIPAVPDSSKGIIPTLGYCKRETGPKAQLVYRNYSWSGNDFCSTQYWSVITTWYRMHRSIDRQPTRVSFYYRDAFGIWQSENFTSQSLELMRLDTASSANPSLPQPTLTLVHLIGLRLALTVYRS